MTPTQLTEVKCKTCDDLGYIAVPSHHPQCTDSICHMFCPVQYQEICPDCSGRILKQRVDALTNSLASRGGEKS